MIEFAHPYWLIAIIPVGILLFFIIWKDFAKMQADRKRIAKARKWLLASRVVFFVLIIVAVANPTILVKSELQTTPAIEMLVDRSDSMAVFDTGFMPVLEKQLSEKIPVEVKTIAANTTSDIGDSILSSLEEDKNILLVSDGRVTGGTELSDVAIFASSINATISVINLEPSQKDISLSILGPAKTVIGVQNTFVVDKSMIGSPDEAEIEVAIDGVKQNSGSVSYTFATEGYHTITAKIGGSDFFSNNNEFYKTVKVVDKPRVLYVSEKQDPLVDILRQLYTLEELSSIPSDLSKYHAVILNDLPAARISDIDALREYVIDGNGLVVIGGFESFDRGEYKNSVFESILPVQVGTGEKRRGGSNIVILYDISGSTRGTTELGGKIVDVERALAASVINDLASSNRVSVVAFNTNAYRMSPLEPLLNNREKLIEKLNRISTGGGTSLSVGLSAAYDVLKDIGGDRIIIMLSDGFSNGELDIVKSMELARIYGNQGIKIYTIGVGRYANSELLKEIASEGHGSFFKADESHRISVLFGEPGESTENKFSLFVVDSGHFITAGLDLDAQVDAFNQVAPKTSSRLLVTTDNRNPAVTVWRYGIGRVVTVTSFSTSNNLGEILNSKNSLLVTRIVNWAVGDPERNEEYSVSVDDARLNNDVAVRVRSSSYPEAEGLNFFKAGENEYIGRFSAASTGIHNVLNAKYAVNYEKEYESLGISPGLEYVVSATGGKFFNAGDVDSIVDYVKSVSRKTRVTEISMQWVFIAAALLVLLTEVCMRRLRVMAWQGI